MYDYNIIYQVQIKIYIYTTLYIISNYKFVENYFIYLSNENGIYYNIINFNYNCYLFKILNLLVFITHCNNIVKER